VVPPLNGEGFELLSFCPDSPIFVIGHYLFAGILFSKVGFGSTLLSRSSKWNYGCSLNSPWLYVLYAQAKLLPHVTVCSRVDFSNK